MNDVQPPFGILRTNTLEVGVIKRALFSEDLRYRYRLDRDLDSLNVDRDRRIVFVMLNPSTADENDNDPTVERCERRARRLGYGGFSVVNLFAYRSTDPQELKRVEHPIGPENDAVILATCRTADTVVVAWGNTHAKLGLGTRSLHVIALLQSASIPLFCLGTNSDNSPKHPLYLRNDQPLVRFA